jgi:RND superfamily putative drug exporter
VPANVPVAEAPVGKASTVAPARRPADLADHLRESRPADLSDYTSGTIPGMRRPVDEPPAPAPARRPATLADHLSARTASEETTRDLRDHATHD